MQGKASATSIHCLYLLLLQVPCGRLTSHLRWWRLLGAAPPPPLGMLGLAAPPPMGMQQAACR
jgi:hypothetical protein